jgi:hypothetical protein
MFSSACPTQAAAEVFQFQRRSLNRKLARLVGVPERCDLTCVIGLSVEEYRPYACDRCGGEQTKVIWLGTLSDVLSANEGFFSESDVITSDDIVGDRLEIILGLQMLARKQGFTHCEVREYSVSDPLKYVPLFSGPLPVPGLAS